MSIHTCPRCELRFERENELRDHLVADHRLDPDAMRAHPVPTREPGMRQRVVVVGNHTLLSDRLRARLVEVTAAGGVDVHVVVPGKSLHHARVDRVLVSTLPEGISKWLSADLPGRLRHLCHAPVEVVTAEG
jgi:hypothetical protein